MLVQIEAENNSRVVTYKFSGIPIYLGPTLRNRKTKRERWVNIYPRRVGGHYATKDEALENAFPDMITTIKIEWEE